MINKQSFIRTFSNWAIDSNHGFSSACRYQARLCFVDTLACMLVGAEAPQTTKAYDAMLQTGAGGTVHPVFGNQALSATAAALVNGTAAHAQDFDDYEASASTHPSAPIVSAILALSELNDVTIGQAVTSYLVGYEAIIRIGESLGYEHYMHGWHATSTVGPIGAAAACACLLGLDNEGIANALSLSMSMSSGLKAQFGSDSKAIHAGLAARAGIEAALMAKSGISANSAY